MKYGGIYDKKEQQIKIPQSNIQLFFNDICDFSKTKNNTLTEDSFITRQTIITHLYEAAMSIVALEPLCIKPPTSSMKYSPPREDPIASKKPCLQQDNTHSSSLAFSTVITDDNTTLVEGDPIDPADLAASRTLNPLLFFSNSYPPADENYEDYDLEKDPLELLSLLD